MASDISVMIEPNFNSNSCQEILGCTMTASSDSLRKAYRDLSRKHHPEQNRSRDDTRQKFIRIYVAYSTLCDTTKSPEERGLFNQDDMDIVTEEEAKDWYDKEFGEYRRNYYSSGAIIGIPYSYKFQESLERSKCLREAFSFSISCMQFSFFRSWLIKKELSFFLLLIEILCTWGTIVLAVLNFLLEEYPEILDEIPYLRDLGLKEIPHVGIIGGVTVLLGNFTQYFWYGFTRYPIITDRYYGSWLRHGETLHNDEISDVQDVCSFHFHRDTYQRSQICTLLTCFPLVLVDHIVTMIASAPVSLFYMCKNCCIQNQPSRKYPAYQFSKSIGSLISIIGYYLLWVLLGNYVKLGVATALVVNQNLYNAILFRKGYGGFLQSFIFGSVFVITIIHEPMQKPLVKEKDLSTDLEMSTDIERGASKPNYSLQATKMYAANQSAFDTGTETTGSDDRDLFEAKFDGFYSSQVPRTKGTPLPSWHSRGNYLKRNQTTLDDMEKTLYEKNASMFQCGDDTILDEKKEDQPIGDVILLYKSVKRRIESEFYSRLLGEPHEEDNSTPKERRDGRSPSRKGKLFAVPSQIEMNSNVMLDECSSTSGSIPLDSTAGPIQINRKTEISKGTTSKSGKNIISSEERSVEDLDDVLGEFDRSRSGVVEEHNYQQKHPKSILRESKIHLKASRSGRKLNDIPQVVDLPEEMPDSTDESEITADFKQFGNNRQVENPWSPTNGPGAFWKMFPSLSPTAAKYTVDA